MAVWYWYWKTAKCLNAWKQNLCINLEISTKNHNLFLSQFHLCFLFSIIIFRHQFAAEHGWKRYKRTLFQFNFYFSVGQNSYRENFVRFKSKIHFRVITSTTFAHRITTQLVVTDIENTILIISISFIIIFNRFLSLDLFGKRINHAFVYYFFYGFDTFLYLIYHPKVLWKNCSTLFLPRSSTGRGLLTSFACFNDACNPSNSRSSRWRKAFDISISPSFLVPNYKIHEKLY